MNKAINCEPMYNWTTYDYHVHIIINIYISTSAAVSILQGEGGKFAISHCSELSQLTRCCATVLSLTQRANFDRIVVNFACEQILHVACMYNMLSGILQ